MKNRLIVFLGCLMNLVLISCSLLEPNDVLDVQLKGMIYDSNSKKPLERCKIIVFNSSYIEEKGDYTDYSSYLNHDTISLTSDQNGKFSTILKRSAQIDIRVYKKGYELAEIYNLKPQKKTVKNFYLKKGKSKETDLLKPVEVIEIEDR